MPPKGKKGKKKLPLIIDGIDTSTMTREQLEAFALRLKAEMEHEREERNFFQMERDKIRTFWEVNRQELEEVKSEVRQKQKQMDMVQDIADVDVKKVEQQMKYISYETNRRIGDVRAEAIVQLQLAQQNYNKQEIELLRDKRELRRMLREAEEMREMQMREIIRDCNEKMLQQQLGFDRERKDHEALLTERMNDQRQRVTLFYRTQMAEVEERKNTQIKRLQEHHDKAFNNMKNYYNDITLNNLALISSLKEQLETLRKYADRNERIARDLQNENRRLKTPLEQSNALLKDLRRKLDFYERDKTQLVRLKQRNNILEKHNTSLIWEMEALKLRNDSLTEERENLKSHFNEIVTELQQKTGLKNVLLERKIQALLLQSEKREIILKETLSQCAPNFALKLDGLEKRVEMAVDEKTKIIADLRYQLAAAHKAHDDLLDTYECKMKLFGVPKEELGFTPYRNKPQNDQYLPGPAGLVTENQ